MLRCVALVRTDVTVERGASIIRVTRIGELGTLFLADYRQPDNGGATFLRNVGSYKSHKALHPRRRHSSITTTLQVGGSRIRDQMR
jgi:hypothetical protein